MSSQVTNRLTSLATKLRRELTLEFTTCSALLRPDLTQVPDTYQDMSIPIMGNDRDLVIDTLVMRVALLHDLLRSTSAKGDEDLAAPAMALRRTLMGLKTLDVNSYAEDWKFLRSILTSQRVLDCDDDWKELQRLFKGAAACCTYRWTATACLAIIGGKPKGWFKSLNQWIEFDSRLNLRSLDLAPLECATYLDFERKLEQPRWEALYYGSTRYDETIDSANAFEYLNLAPIVAKELVGDFTITDYPFRPRHSSGATAEVGRSDADKWHKNRQFRVDSEVITYLKYRLSRTDTDWRDWFYTPYKGLDRTSILVCVPKKLNKNRTISKEPSTLQFLQQDVFRALDDYFHENLSDYVDLHDQSKSRALAQKGSYDGSYATLDLSSASDSVTVALLQFLLGGLQIEYPLMATRSNECYVSATGYQGQSVVLNKYAGMGNGTTFPVEVIAFLVCCGTAVRIATGRKMRAGDALVYGDDIIIRDDCADVLVDVLEFFGFSVAEHKSFSKRTDGVRHRFRESCGIECLDGEDVTPLRLPRRLVSLTNNDARRQAGQGVGMIDLYNRVYLRGYVELGRWINHTLNKYEWYRTALRLEVSDYYSFRDAIAGHRIPWVRVAAPFVLTADSGATQWRSYGTKVDMEPKQALVSGFKDTGKCQGDPCIQQAKARVSIAVSRRRRQHHDSNDYYSWCLAQVTQPLADDIFTIDETGLVTIRSQDLKWSKAWVVLTRIAHQVYPLVME